MLYVTFRSHILEDVDSRTLAKMMVKEVNPVLKERSKKYDGTLQVSINKLFKTYVILSMSEDYTKITNCHKKVAKILSEFTVPAADIDQKGTTPVSFVLAVEYLQKQTQFGKQASLKEMKSLKTKCKKQEPVYDPEEEERKEKERRKKEAEERGVEVEDIEEELR